jgi:hypothetical protein
MCAAASLFSCADARCSAPPLPAQTYEAAKPRKHFVSVSSTRSTPSRCTSPSIRSAICSAAGGEHAGQEFEYRTRDDATLIDVIEFSRRQRGLAPPVSVRHEYAGRR